MSYDLGSYDPASGAIVANDLGGFSLKKTVKGIGKTVKKIAAPVAAVATVVGIPGAGIVQRVTSSKAVTKAKAIQKAVKTPPKPPPKPNVNLVAKQIPPFRAGSRTGSGVFSDVRSGSSTTANPKTLQKAKHIIVKKATNDAASKLGVKAKGGKIAPAGVQAKAAGLKFRKRHKKGGGTEVVATDANGAVVSGPIPQAAVERAGVTIESGPPIPADSVQAAPPPMPSVEQAQNMINAAVAQSVPEVPSSSGGGSSPVAPTGTTPETPKESGKDNTLLYVGGAAAALFLLPMLTGGRR